MFPNDKQNKQDVLIREIGLAIGIPWRDVNVRLSFIQNGGHSMSALLLQHRCKVQGFRLTITSILQSRSIHCLFREADLISPSEIPKSRISNSQPVTLHHGSQDDSAKMTTENNYAAVQPMDSQSQTMESSAGGEHPGAFGFVGCSYAPMTDMQLSLLHGSERRPGINYVYHTERYLTRHIPALKRAWNTVHQAESVFKIRFDLASRRMYISDRELPPFLWTEETRKAETLPNHSTFKPFQLADAYSGFHVIHDPQESSSTITWWIHHALIDGFSSDLVLGKVHALFNGASICPGPSFLGVARDLEQLQRRTHSRLIQFWAANKARAESSLNDFPFPYPLSSVTPCPSMPCAISFTLPADVLRKISEDLSITLASLTYTAWALALSFYSGCEDVVFGIVLSGRNLPLDGVETAIGPLINMLPLQVTVNESSTSIGLLEYVQQKQLELSELQHSIPAHGFLRNFASGVGMILETGEVDSGRTPQVSPPSITVATDIPMTVNFNKSGHFDIQYDPNRYRSNDAHAISRVFIHMLTALPSRPQSVLKEVLDNARSKEDVTRLTTFSNSYSGLTRLGSVQHDLVTLFEKATMSSKTSTAIQKGLESVTYAELNTQATQLASQLSHMILPREVICVYADRSINWIIAIYGILKARGVYCPLDRSLPSKLRDSNFIFSGSRIFLATSYSNRRMAPTPCKEVFSVDELLTRAPAESQSRLLFRTQASPSSAAYVCFTSGSTGKPKGVICNHEGLVAFQSAIEVRLFARPGVKVAQFMSPAFDGSIHEIFSALSYGATLVLANAVDPFEVLRHATTALLTPSAANALDPTTFLNLDYTYLVGESVPQNVCDRWASHTNLFNMYGPTEGTCGATIKRLQPNVAVTIGRPVPTMRLYILDLKDRLVPHGVIGQIALAGIQVSRGYIGNIQETQRKFVHDQFVAGNERMYLTGDQGYWNENGEVVCVGRLDRQIKLNGYRLDLADLERCMLQAFPAASGVAVACKSDFLICLVTPELVDVQKFRSAIAGSIQHFAIPRQIIAVHKIPLTLTGKVDEKAVAAMQSAAVVDVPLSDWEKQISSIWASALRIPPNVSIRRNSSFQDLGADSLAMLLLSSKLSKHCGRDVTLRMLLELPTLAMQAKALKKMMGYACMKTPVKPLGETAVSSIEHDWLRKFEDVSVTSSFNVSYACHLSRLVDIAKLGSAFDEILSRHKVLQSRFILDSKGRSRRTFTMLAPKVRYCGSINLNVLVNIPFDPSNEDLIRVFISPQCLLLVASHIICDLTSLELMLQQASSIYQDIPIDPVNVTYADSTRWSQHISPEDLAFWKSYMQVAVTADQPTAPLKKPDMKFKGTSYVLRLPEQLVMAMDNLISRRNSTHHNLIIAAVGMVLQYRTGWREIIVGAPYLNRPSEDDLKTVGLFLEPLPIVLPNLKEEKDILRAVSESSRQAVSHAVPWSELSKRMNFSCPDGGLDKDLFETMVSFHSRPAGAEFFQIAGFTPLYIWTQGAKFSTLFEFLQVKPGTVVLRIEYNEAVNSEEDILGLEALTIQALHLLTSEVKTSDLSSELQERPAISPVRSVQTKDFFGKAYDQL